MVLTNAFKEAVSSGNVRRVRIMMEDGMLIDPTFYVFNEMNKAARDLSGLYDVHDGRDLNYDKNTWDDSYMNDLMVEIVGNFSHERVDHLKEVVRHLRPVAIHSQEVHSHSRPVSESEKTSRETYTDRHDCRKQKCHDQENNSSRGTKIGSGAIIGAVAGGTIAAVASISVMSGVALGAVAGAVVASVMADGE